VTTPVATPTHSKGLSSRWHMIAPQMAMHLCQRRSDRAATGLEARVEFARQNSWVRTGPAQYVDFVATLGPRDITSKCSLRPGSLRYTAY